MELGKSAVIDRSRRLKHVKIEQRYINTDLIAKNGKLLIELDFNDKQMKRPFLMLNKYIKTAKPNSVCKVFYFLGYKSFLFSKKV